MNPYRFNPTKCAPKTPWYRLLWALLRGLNSKLKRRQKRLANPVIHLTRGPGQFAIVKKPNPRPVPPKSPTYSE